MDKIIGAIRVTMAALIGKLLTWLFGIAELDPAGRDSELFELLSSLWVDGSTLVLTGVAYFLIRLISAKFPALEWLLLIPKAPVYVAPEDREFVTRSVENYKRTKGS